MNQRKRPNFRRPLALLLALALCLTLAAPALAAENAAASSIQLSKTEGTVSATNSAGRSVSLIKNLYSQPLNTALAGLLPPLCVKFSCHTSVCPRKFALIGGKIPRQFDVPWL